MAGERQDLIGGLVAKVLIEKGIKTAIETGLEKVAVRKDTIMQPSDVDKATAIVAQEVKKEVQSRVDHVTDNEPFYKSRSMLSVIVGLMVEFGILYQFWTDDVVQDFQTQVAPHLIVIGTLLGPVYSRYFAKKPLGE